MAWHLLSGDPRLTGPLAGQGYGGPLAPGGYAPDFSEADPAALQLNANPMAVDYLGALRQALPQAAARYRVSQFQPGVPQPGLIHDVGYGYGGPVGGAVADMLQAPKTGLEAGLMVGMPIKAYHGSPHDFERFDMSKIGTGEGAQVYGHGLYFAENSAVAAEYRKALGNAEIEIGGKRHQPVVGSPEDIALAHLEDAQSAGGGNPHQAAVASLKSAREIASPYLRPKFEKALDVLSHWEKAGAKVVQGGRSYEVSINADPEHFLDWDKPLSEQPKAVQEAMQKAGFSAPIASMPAKYQTAGNMIQTEMRVGNAQKTTEALRAVGIKGIRYKDQGSRGAEGGTHNYVVFDDKIIDILKKYGIAGLTGGAAATGILSGQQQQRPGT